MTEASVLQTQVRDSILAGTLLGRDILERFAGQSPDVLVVFASPIYNADLLVRSLKVACTPGAVIGCSSAGEFTSDGTSARSVVALALISDDMRFQVRTVGQLRADPRRAAVELAATLDDGDDAEFPFRTALLLMDALAGFGEEFIDAFNQATSGRYQIFGGGAADDAAFLQTYVFAGEESMTNAAVILEIRSRQPIGIGISHGWTPAGPAMSVTSSDGLKLLELDGIPAGDVFEAFARNQGQVIDRESPLTFFLNHVLGIETADGYKLRVPLTIEEDGSILCAAEVPVRSTVRIMRSSSASAADAAGIAARQARAAIGEKEAGVAVFFDCAATRLRLGDEFGSSVSEVLNAIGPASCIGCNTYGQFARLKGQSSAFHNCTAVVCVFPG